MQQVRYPPWRKRTENPCVGGSIPPHTTEPLIKSEAFYFMYFVYILYSMSSRKTYVGYTNDINRRVQEHNITESSGFTLRYRPWTLIRTEQYASKSEALEREKYLKTGKGREEVKFHVVNFLDSAGAVSAVAEKD